MIFETNFFFLQERGPTSREIQFMTNKSLYQTLDNIFGTHSKIETICLHKIKLNVT